MLLTQQIETVTLAGAGPGDAELITLKLQKRLAAADVIIVDRLVNPDIITMHASASAVVLSAAKQGYNEASVSQRDINNWLVQYALQGKKVLRLKGGDVAFFSNALDELQVLREHQIPFEIIPGITAASGASAYAGIPLTARGYAQGVQFLSLHNSAYFSSEKWKSLANTNDTLVFYMSGRKLGDLVELLLRYTRNPHTPLAVVEQATTPYQQVHVSTLTDCMADFAGIQFASPSLVVIGGVVDLHASYKWYEHMGENGTIFSPLEFKS